MVILITVVNNDCIENFIKDVAPCILQYIVTILGIMVIMCVVLGCFNYNFVLYN